MTTITVKSTLINVKALNDTNTEKTLKDLNLGKSPSDNIALINGIKEELKITDISVKRSHGTDASSIDINIFISENCANKIEEAAKANVKKNIIVPNICSGFDSSFSILISQDEDDATLKQHGISLLKKYTLIEENAFSLTNIMVVGRKFTAEFSLPNFTLKIDEDELLSGSFTSYTNATIQRSCLSLIEGTKCGETSADEIHLTCQESGCEKELNDFIDSFGVKDTGGRSDSNKTGGDNINSMRDAFATHQETQSDIIAIGAAILTGGIISLIISAYN